jgi:hypothetical protein
MIRLALGTAAALLLALSGCAVTVKDGGSGGNGAGGGGAGGAGGGGTGGGDPAACKEYQAELAAELSLIQSCTADDECGTELKGLSCGCTRNLIARLDADTTHFYELLEKGKMLDCGILGSTCDCPEADGFVCTNGVCGWNYVQQP